MNPQLNYCRAVLKVSTTQLCQQLGWNIAHSNALELLVDLTERYILQMAKITHSYSEQFGRTDPNLDDLSLAMQDMRTDIVGLAEYLEIMEPPPFVQDTVRFPVDAMLNLEPLPKGCQEHSARDEHVYEYFPTMYPEMSDGQSHIDPCMPKDLELLEKKRIALESSPAKKSRPLPEEARPSQYAMKSVIMSSQGYITPILGSGKMATASMPEVGKLPQGRHFLRTLQPLVKNSESNSPDGSDINVTDVMSPMAGKLPACPFSRGTGRIAGSPRGRGIRKGRLEAACKKVKTKVSVSKDKSLTKNSGKILLKVTGESKKRPREKVKKLKTLPPLLKSQTAKPLIKSVEKKRSNDYLSCQPVKSFMEDKPDFKSVEAKPRVESFIKSKPEPKEIPPAPPPLEKKEFDLPASPASPMFSDQASSPSPPPPQEVLSSTSPASNHSTSPSPPPLHQEIPVALQYPDNSLPPSPVSAVPPVFMESSPAHSPFSNLINSSSSIELLSHHQPVRQPTPPPPSSTKCPPPSSKIAPPFSKTAPPSSKTTPPSSKTAPPSSKTAPPSSKTAPPSSKIAPPSSKTAPPSSKTAPPSSKTVSPSSSKLLSSTSRNPLNPSPPPSSKPPASKSKPSKFPRSSVLSKRGMGRKSGKKKAALPKSEDLFDYHYVPKVPTPPPTRVVTPPPPKVVKPLAIKTSPVSKHASPSITPAVSPSTMSPSPTSATDQCDDNDTRKDHKKEKKEKKKKKNKDKDKEKDRIKEKKKMKVKEDLRVVPKLNIKFGDGTGASVTSTQSDIAAPPPLVMKIPTKAMVKEKILPAVKYSTGAEKKSEPERGVFTETIEPETGQKVWICPACQLQDDGSPMVGCDGCEEWYHWPCVGLSAAPSTSQWFCPRCNSDRPAKILEKKKKRRPKKI